jgi:hypothetical protein
VRVDCTRIQFNLQAGRADCTRFDRSGRARRFVRPVRIAVGASPATELSTWAMILIGMGSGWSIAVPRGSEAGVQTRRPHTAETAAERLCLMGVASVIEGLNFSAQAKDE